MAQADCFFIELIPETVDQIFETSKSLDGWVFRGQADESWRLTTSLERAAQRLGCPLDQLAQREELMLRGFKRRAHLYPPHLPSESDKVEWVALMQHYGCPTRFIDFTRSFFTALFFAVEDATEKAAIWAVNTTLLQHKLKEGLTNARTYERASPLDRNGEHIGQVNQLIGNDTKHPMVIDVEPERLNERMVAQQGLFLVPFTLDLSFNQNLSEMFGLPATAWESPRRPQKGETLDVAQGTVVKIVVRRNLIRSVIRQLENANTTALTLFPGLDGFARSLQFQLM